MIYGVQGFGTFVLGTVFIILLPGANSMYVLTTAAKGGIVRGYRAALGVAAGDSLLMLLSVAGAASLLRSNQALFHVVKYLGAAYLAWIGFNLLRSAIVMLRSRKAATATTEAVAEVEAKAVQPQNATEIRRRRGPFLTAMVVCLLNPKSILFFVAFFVQFIDPHYAHPTLSFLVLAVTMQTVSLLYLSLLIFCGTYLAEHFRRHRRTSGSATFCVGMAFLGFGLKLATATLR